MAKKTPKTHDFTRSYLRLKDGDQIKVIKSQAELDAFNKKKSKDSK